MEIMSEKQRLIRNCGRNPELSRLPVVMAKKFFNCSSNERVDFMLKSVIGINSDWNELDFCAFHPSNYREICT